MKEFLPGSSLSCVVLVLFLVWFVLFVTGRVEECNVETRKDQTESCKDKGACPCGVDQMKTTDLAMGKYTTSPVTIWLKSPFCCLPYHQPEFLATKDSKKALGLSRFLLYVATLGFRLLLQKFP